jgi:hypothetical protein
LPRNVQSIAPLYASTQGMPSAAMSSMIPSVLALEAALKIVRDADRSYPIPATRPTAGSR